MKNKILVVIAGLILIFSSILVIHVLTNDSEDSEFNQNQDYSIDDLLKEIDVSLLDEDGEIEIGEMI